MALISPILDDRSFAQLKDELVRRIPVYTQEWTDYNETDPGIALLELFAYLGESVLYRFNQIPETTKIEFLRLLGVQARPARPATAVIAGTTELAAGVQIPLRHRRHRRQGSVPHQRRDLRLAARLRRGRQGRSARPAGAAGRRRHRHSRYRAEKARRADALARAGLAPAAGRRVLRHDPAGHRPERPGRRTARRLDHAGPVAVDRGAAQEDHRPRAPARPEPVRRSGLRRGGRPALRLAPARSRSDTGLSQRRSDRRPSPDGVAAVERPGSRRDHLRGGQRHHPRPGHHRSGGTAPAAPATRSRHAAAGHRGRDQPAPAGRREAGGSGGGLDQRRPAQGRPPQRRDPQGALGRAQRGPGRAVPGGRARAARHRDRRRRRSGTRSHS